MLALLKAAKLNSFLTGRHCGLLSFFVAGIRILGVILNHYHFLFFLFFIELFEHDSTLSNAALFYWKSHESAD
jgi:hypothetical protein